MNTVALLNEIYLGPAWHGPSVKEALDGITADTAAKKLDADRNSIWELVLHLAHGRHLLVERVNDGPSPAFPRKIREPWWPVIDYDMTEDAWQKDLQLLDDCHAKLLDAVTNATPAQLARVPAPGDQPIGQQLVGLAIHDGYHAGQIKQLALHFGGVHASP
ncbi:MAG: DinB family protein [bacterium]